jgi:SAM-dependent methyltransferase
MSMAYVPNRRIGILPPVPQHHLGGKKATEELTALADIHDGQKVLVLGCGDGETAIRISMTYNCEVIATDIDPLAIKEASKRLRRKKKKSKGNVVFEVDNILNSHLLMESFDRIVVESVLIMLPKDTALNVIHSLLAPEGVLAMNEAVCLSDNVLELKEIENEFRKADIIWSLPSYDEWQCHLRKNNFAIMFDASPVPCKIACVAVETLIRHPLRTMTWILRMLINHSARTFYIRTWFLMVKARIEWGYCIWLCRRA